MRMSIQGKRNVLTFYMRRGEHKRLSSTSPLEKVNQFFYSLWLVECWGLTESLLGYRNENNPENGTNKQKIKKKIRERQERQLKIFYVQSHHFGYETHHKRAA
jgi:hypothetical protein